MSVASSAILTTEPVNSEGIVAAGAYVDGRRVANIAIGEASSWRSRPGHVVWIGLHEPDMALLTSVQRQFQLHDLAIEDADHAHQRPKIEQYGDALFIVARTAQLVGDSIAFGETHLFVGEGYLVSVRHGASTSYTPVRERCESCPRALARGEDYILYAILDFIVDNYSPVLETIQEEVEAMEALVLASAMTRVQIERLYLLRRDLLRLRNAGLSMTTCRWCGPPCSRCSAMSRTTSGRFRSRSTRFERFSHLPSRRAFWSVRLRRPRSRKNWPHGLPSSRSRPRSPVSTA
jgi:magnesium transporter